LKEVLLSEDPGRVSATGCGVLRDKEANLQALQQIHKTGENSGLLLVARLKTTCPQQKGLFGIPQSTVGNPLISNPSDPFSGTNPIRISRAGEVSQGRGAFLREPSVLEHLSTPDLGKLGYMFDSGGTKLLAGPTEPAGPEGRRGDCLACREHRPLLRTVPLLLKAADILSQVLKALPGGKRLPGLKGRAEPLTTAAIHAG
jgi:hypothetical protein